MTSARANIGVIDDGCPFAHVHLRGTVLTDPTVRFIWDQGSGSFLTRNALTVLLAGATTAARADPSPVTPLSASALSDAVGVNTHVTYFDTGYGRLN